ncbi:MAG: IclR family transcriptional regulator [Eubacteriales bacterium]
MNRTSQRTMEILKFVAESKKPVALHDIVENMEIPKSSAFSILQTLIQMNYISPHSQNDKHYSIGVETFALGMKYAADMSLTRETDVYLDPLAQKFGKTGFVALLEGLDIIYVQKYKSQGAMLASCEIGTRRQAHTTALGKCMMAYMQSDELERMIQKITFEKLTVYTVDNEEDLRKQIAEIREKGYALDVKENNSMLVCCSVPIFDHSNQVVAAISLSDIFKVDEDILLLAKELQEVGQIISRKLGYLIS